MLADKTGALIATAGRYGAMFSGDDARVVETMRDYGEKVGIAFQLADPHQALYVAWPITSGDYAPW